jgi:microcystin-dependent protein
MTTATSYAGTVITSFREATDFTQAGATWLVCDGRWLNNSAYPALSAALSGRYGASGVSQFALPDLRNYTIVGADSTSQRVILGPGASGTGAGTVQPSMMVTHSHFYAFSPGAPDFVQNGTPGFLGQNPSNTPGGPASTSGTLLEPSGVSLGLYATPSGTDLGTPGQDLQVAHFPVVAFVRAD